MSNGLDAQTIAYAEMIESGSLTTQAIDAVANATTRPDGFFDPDAPLVEQAAISQLNTSEPEAVVALNNLPTHTA